MSTYLSRPVFPFELDWRSNPAKTFSYDLAPIVLGQANARYQPTQNEIVTGFEFELLLETETMFEAWNTFADTCQGKLNGFWFVGQNEVFKISAYVDSQNIQITHQHAGDGDLAGKYVIFRKTGQTDQYAKITTIATVGAVEQIVLESALGVAIDSTWEAFRLFYCRFAADDDTIEFEINNCGFVKLRLIELPEEYIAVETGQKPVFLYEFTYTGVTLPWRFTSLNQQVTSNGNTFNSYQISHQGHSQSLRGGQNTLTINTIYDAASPVVKLFPFQSPSPLYVTIYETTFTAPNTVKTIFAGLVESMSLNGQAADLQCTTIIAAVGRQFPRFFIQNRCNYQVYDSQVGYHLCDAIRANHSVYCVVYDVGARNLLVKAALNSDDPDEYAFGLLEWRGADGGLEYRTIESVIVTDAVNRLMQLTLTQPLRNAAPLDVVTFYRGCDGTAKTCTNRFNNFVNWGGHSFAPKNLAISAIQPSANNNKK